MSTFEKLAAKDLAKLKTEHDLAWIDLRFTDPRGKWQHLTMDAGVFDEDMIEDGVMAGFVEDRYAGWRDGNAQAMLNGGQGLEEIAARVQADDINPQAKSGRQEYLENIVNRYV